MLTIYSKTICPKCIYVKRELKSKGIDFEEINIDHDEAALELLQSKNLQGLPVVKIDNNFTNNHGEIMSWIDEQ